MRCLNSVLNVWTWKAKILTLKARIRTLKVWSAVIVRVWAFMHVINPPFARTESEWVMSLMSSLGTPSAVAGHITSSGYGPHTATAIHNWLPQIGEGQKGTLKRESQSSDVNCWRILRKRPEMIWRLYDVLWRILSHEQRDRDVAKLSERDVMCHKLLDILVRSHAVLLHSSRPLLASSFDPCRTDEFVDCGDSVAHGYLKTWLRSALV